MMFTQTLLMARRMPNLDMRMKEMPSPTGMASGKPIATKKSERSQPLNSTGTEATIQSGFRKMRRNSIEFQLRTHCWSAR